MSLIRNSSRKQFSVNSNDLVSSLDQKNSMIAILQAQIEGLQFIQQKSVRIQQQLYRAKQKYDNCMMDYGISKLSNLQRLDLTAKSCLQLKIQLEHLRKEVDIKGQQIRAVKGQSQQLVGYSNRREDQSDEAQIRGEQLRTANQIMKLEEDRSRSQVTLAREQLQRQRKQNANINKSLQTIKDKCYKSQAYIRNIIRQESTLNQSLAKIQAQNNYLDGHISELNTFQSMRAQEGDDIEKQIQEGRFFVTSKQIELKRTQKEIKQKARNLGAEKDKFKVVNEQAEQKKSALSRIQSQVTQCSQEINYILGKNNQVSDVNSHLRNDLQVCKRHLQNVMRVNKNMQVELNRFKQINLMTIKKLQQPMGDTPNRQPLKAATTAKWHNVSKMTATEGYQYSSM